MREREGGAVLIGCLLLLSAMLILSHEMLLANLAQYRITRMVHLMWRYRDQAENAFERICKTIDVNHTVCLKAVSREQTLREYRVPTRHCLKAMPQMTIQYWLKRDSTQKLAATTGRHIRLQIQALAESRDHLFLQRFSTVLVLRV